MKIQKKKRKSASKIVTPAHVDTVEGKFIFKKKKVWENQAQTQKQMLPEQKQRSEDRENQKKKKRESEKQRSENRENQTHSYTRINGTRSRRQSTK